MTVGELTVSPGGLSRSTGGPASPSLPWVLGALVPHLRRYDAPLRLPPCPSQVASRVARFPIPGLLPSVRGVPKGLVPWWKPPRHARTFGRPVSQAGNMARRQVALPRSRATPMAPCPALSPRWCPRHLPSRVQDCCLPATGNRRLSPQDIFASYPVVHDSTPFGAPSRGLHPRSIPLRTPIAECARGYHS